MKYIEVEKKAVYTGHKDGLYALETAGDFFYTAGSDGMVVRWQINRENLGEVVAKVKNTVYAIQYLPDQNHLLIGQNQEGINLVDLAGKKETASVALGQTSFFDIKVFRERCIIATGLGEVITLSYPSLKKKSEIKLSDQSARCIAINPSKKEFAVGYSDHSIRIFSLEDSRLLTTLNHHENSVFSLIYSPDGHFLFSGGRDAQLAVWNVADGYELEQSIAAHLYTVNHIAFRPDGKYFATCSKDKSIKVWDTEKRKLLKVIDKARHAGHGTSVNKIAWLSEDQLVSISDDHTASLWKVRFKV